MEHIAEAGSEQLDAVLDLVAALAVRVRGNASEALDVVSRIDALCDRLQGVRMDLLHEAQVSGEPGLSAAERLHATNRVSLSSSRRDVRLACDLSDRFSLIAQSWRDGVVSGQQARGIVAGLKHLPVAMTRLQLDARQAELVGFAVRLDPDELRVVAERMAEVIDPERAEALEADRIERDARIAHARRALVVVPDHQGSMLIRGQVPIADGELFLAQLTALTPSAASYRLTGELPDRSARRADALVRWCGIAAASGQLPAAGGDRPQVLVTLGPEALVHGMGAGTMLASGEPLSAGEARRLSCDAHITPTVLGGASEVLDVGRTHRFFTRPIRAALVLRDQGCVFPGCDAPPAACEGHHTRPWWSGGTTCVSNGVLLCPYHHLVEPDPNRSAQVQWQILIDPGNGLPWFTPPRQIDPARAPRLHHRFLLRGTGPPPSQEQDWARSLPQVARDPH